MHISINVQPQRFPLAFNDGWKSGVGHEIKVGQYRFCAIPKKDVINITEISSGMKFFDIPVDLTVYLITGTKEDTIKFFYQVGERIKKIIAKQPNFGEMLEQMKKKSFELHGEMPEIEDVDMEKELGWGKGDSNG